MGTTISVNVAIYVSNGFCYIKSKYQGTQIAVYLLTVFSCVLFNIGFLTRELLDVRE
jgi:hypothetical protein